MRCAPTFLPPFVLDADENRYGALTGLNKRETVERYGEAQVKAWRRSFATRPPPIEADSPYWPGNDNKYAHVPLAQVPAAECLADTVARTLPFWEDHIVPCLSRSKTVLVAAHGNSIRGIAKHLDSIADDAITEVSSTAREAQRERA